MGYFGYLYALYSIDTLMIQHFGPPTFCSWILSSIFTSGHQYCGPWSVLFHFQIILTPPVQYVWQWTFFISQIICFFLPHVYCAKLAELSIQKRVFSFLVGELMRGSVG